MADMGCIASASQGNLVLQTSHDYGTIYIHAEESVAALSWIDSNMMKPAVHEDRQ